MSSSSAAPIVRFEGIAFDTARGRVLDGVDLELSGGDALSVIGPNGAGKTTLLRMLVGLLTPSEGVRRLQGRRYRDLGREELARAISYVPQVRPARVPLTVEKMLVLARYPHFSPPPATAGALSRWRRAPGANDFEAVERALAQVGIESLRPRPMDELSGGERQLVHIAAALAQETEILVLDEPTSDLDPRHEREVTELLRALRRERLRTVVTATHDLLFAGRISDRVLALKDGRPVLLESVDEALVPERLERVFDTPFRLHRHDGRPVPVVDLTTPSPGSRGD